MFRPAAFVEDDPAALAGLIEAYPLASLIVDAEDGLIAAHAPLLPEQDAEGRLVGLVGHLARPNPFWSAADGRQVLILFSGPDAYVSPSFYASKQEHGKVVPTWNYSRIEVRGKLTAETDPERVRPYFERLTQTLENGRDQPWQVDDAPADYTRKLQRALVGFRIEVSDVKGTFKLSQNRKPADRAGVRDGLNASARPADQAVARMMDGG
jgi:transcriptional regulator